MNLIKWIAAILLACILYPAIVMFFGWALYVLVFILMVAWIKDLIG